MATFLPTAFNLSETARSFALPAGITPAEAGVVVGVVTATLGFLLVAWLTRPRVRRDRDSVTAPPLPMFQASTDLSARAFAKMGVPMGSVASVPGRHLASFVEVSVSDETHVEDDFARDFAPGHLPDTKGYTVRMALPSSFPPPPRVPSEMVRGTEVVAEMRPRAPSSSGMRATTDAQALELVEGRRSSSFPSSPVAARPRIRRISSIPPRRTG